MTYSQPMNFAYFWSVFYTIAIRNIKFLFEKHCDEMVSTQIQRSGVYQKVKLLWQLYFQEIVNTSNKNSSAFIRHCFSKTVI